MSWLEHLRPELVGLSSLRLPDYAAAGDQLARLDCNELPFPVTDDELRDFRAALGEVPLHRYPDVSGAPLRQALAARWSVAPEQILLGNGSIETLAILVSACGGAASGRPPTVLYPDPSFPHYEVIARSHGCLPLAVPLDRSFQLDEPRFAAAIAEHRPAVVIIASPNNPTGNLFDPQVLERLARRADAAFVVDEAYVDFAGHGDCASTMIPRIAEIPGLFVMRTFSKLGFAGLRVGALVGAASAIAELDKVRLPWNLNATSLALARVILSRPERMRARVESAIALRRTLDAELRTIPDLTVFSSEANFILVRTARPARWVFERLLARGVLVKDVSQVASLERCLRITIGTAPENARCAEALREALR